MLKVESLTKKFKLYHSPSDRLKEIIMSKKFHTEFYALNGVSFEVADGESLGIVGQNGAGKSTLMKLLSGILLPDSGSVRIDGKITGLLELGTGFNYEMTGIENVYMNGILLGMSREEIDSKKQDIIDFAELGNFVVEPIKIYSSGMVMRLAFSVAIHADPKCFIVDEALSVGDAYFQQKCIAKIKEFRQSGGSIIFVSHDPVAIKTLCDRAILLDHGVVITSGLPDKVLDYYNALIAKKGEDFEIHQKEISRGHTQTRSGSHEARIESVEMVNSDGKSARVFQVGDEVRILCELSFEKEIDSPTVGVLIRDRLGNDVFGTNSFHVNPIRRTVTKGGRLFVNFTVVLNIGPGDYSLTIAIHAHDTHLSRNYDWWDQVLIFQVIPGSNYTFTGLAYLPVNIEISEQK